MMRPNRNRFHSPGLLKYLTWITRATHAVTMTPARKYVNTAGGYDVADLTTAVTAPAVSSGASRPSTRYGWQQAIASTTPPTAAARVCQYDAPASPTA